jgi:hypothetical protein
MATQIVEITSVGIRKILDKYTPEKAIAEFVWNGFDAKATIINIDFEIENKESDIYKEIRITDNGTGICYEELSNKFKKFHESHKSHKSISNNSNVDLTRGKNGCGRLTFFKFARFAKWKTHYKIGYNIMSYEINANNDDIKQYSTTVPTNSTESIGTSVVFNEIERIISTNFIEKTLIPFLKAEFAWFLELKEEHQIFVNGKELDYSSIIAENDDFPIDVTVNRKTYVFNCKYIRWNKKLNDEYSRFYLLNSQLELKNNQTTKLNKKGDEFWHSVIIVDDFFNNVNYEENENNNHQQRLFFGTIEDKGSFTRLIHRLNDYLKNKRRPFLRGKSNALINKYEEENVFPEFGEEEWDKVRKKGLEDLVKNLYEVEPAVFMKLNKEQKCVFLRLLNMVMDSGERDNLLKIIGEIVDLDSKDREEFAKILEITRLQQVISTIKLITDRIFTLENLRQIVFNHELKANERKHLQTFIEKHYWIFGEEYRMVCAEEVKFETALRKYVYILRGVDEKIFIAHPDKYKEMDLFLTGTNHRDGRPHNIVVEIKNPTTIKKLTNTEFSQLETYMDVILKQDCFNDENEYWTFMLIGQDYDDVIKRKMNNTLTGFMYSGNNYSLYVKKWSEIINEADRRLNYLSEKLKVERNQLSDKTNLPDVMNEITNNSAAEH